MATKFGRKNPDRGVMHWRGRRSCRGQPGSTRGQTAKKNALWLPNLEERAPCESVMH